MSVKRIAIGAGLLWLVCTAVSSLGPTKGFEPTATITLQATSAKQALKALSDAYQTRLEATPQTAAETVTIRFKAVPLSEAMRRIADAVDGSWKQEGESFLLIRTADQQRAERKSEFDLDVAGIRKAIQKRVEDMGKMQAWNADEADKLATKVKNLVKTFNPNAQQQAFYRQATQLSQEAPIGRAVSQIAAIMDPQELAAVPPYYKTVWSTNPTAMQRPLPAAVAPIIEQFISNQAQWAAAIENHHLTAPTVGGTTYWVGDLGDFQNMESSGKVEVVLLTVQRWNESSSFNFELSAYDSKGKRIAQTQSSLGNIVENYMESMKDVPPQPGEKGITQTPEAAELLASRMANPTQSSKPISPALHDELIHPESVDPLSYFLSSSLIQAAELKEVNMVACLTDNAFYSTFMGTAKEVPVDRFLKRLEYFDEASKIADGWLTLKPTRPYRSRTNRVDRKELGKYLRRIEVKRPLSIEERAAFALALPEPQANYLPTVMASLVKARSEDNFDNNMLRLYGLTTPEQRAKMSSSGLPFEALTDQQMEYVSRMVYGVNSNIQFMPPPQARNAQQIDFNLYYNGLLREPTESLPTGIPRRGVIKLKSDSSYVVMAGPTRNQPYDMAPRELDANSLAWQKYSQERIDLFPWMSDEMQKVDLTRLQFGKRLQITITLQFTPSLSIGQSFDEHDPDQFQTVTIDDLSGDFKKQFTDAYANLAQAYASAKPGTFNRGGGANPPP
ncbi:MAG: hypothetical protein P4L46_10585 [Fimbriimonas sp.]|nr:hypothetical protein [Fimbriimonas sp.]